MTQRNSQGIRLAHVGEKLVVVNCISPESFDYTDLIEPIRPKKPAACFTLYLKEHRKALGVPPNEFEEVSPLAARQWYELTESQKAKYKEMSL